jgi:hypothetical protein
MYSIGNQGGALSGSAPSRMREFKT